MDKGADVIMAGTPSSAPGHAGFQRATPGACVAPGAQAGALSCKPDTRPRLAEPLQNVSRLGYY